MKLGELKRMVDGLVDLYGEDAATDFLYQMSAGRTKIGAVTSFRVFLHDPKSARVRFAINYPRGEVEE